jgi:hypothetical protein
MLSSHVSWSTVLPCLPKPFSPRTWSIRQAKVSAAKLGQGEAPRSVAHTPQVGNIYFCRRFYLRLDQVRFHRQPADHGQCLHRHASSRFPGLRETQQIFLAPVASHPGERLNRSLGTFDFFPEWIEYAGEGLKHRGLT